MATENATERGKTANEEETTVVINWQSGDSDNNAFDNSRFDNSGSYENSEDELSYLLQKWGLKKVQMNETPIIFLRKGYGSVIVRIQS
jgi:hypothetical protein